MTVICEECGKVYHIDPDKLDRYKGKALRVRCGECGHVTQLAHLLEKSEAPAEDFAEAVTPEIPSEEPVPEEEQEIPEPSIGVTEKVAAVERRGWLGLRGKMFILFFVIPIIFVGLGGYYIQHQVNQLTKDITTESTRLVTEAGKEQLMQKAKDVAEQCKLYLEAHPNLHRQDFTYDPVFNQIAVQKVGKTGYTCLIQEPQANWDGHKQGWTIWAHPNPNIIGIDDVDLIKKALGPYFNQFWKVLTACKGRKYSEGPYRWKDPDGKIRQKYMAIAPINIPGKPFDLMATAYMDEFTQKTDSLRTYAHKMATHTRNVILLVLLVLILIIGFCIIIYGYRLTRNIQYLTEAADRISVGDLEAEIEIKSKDEIGNLAEAISRMQDSLRFSIERLRRRR